MSGASRAPARSPLGSIRSPTTSAAAVRSGGSCWTTGKRRDSLSKSQLSPLQEEILGAFFQREDRFFLTGGAALAGFHLMHRRTADLDLFTDGPDLLDAGETALRA